MLKVCELQDLDVKFTMDPTGQFQVVEAVRNTAPRSPLEKLNMWYEVSISSTGIDELLEKNKFLEIGHTVEWTLEDLQKLNGSIQMLQPACQMLVQMNGVGFYNSNDIKFQSKDDDVAPAPADDDKPW